MTENILNRRIAALVVVLVTILVVCPLAFSQIQQTLLTTQKPAELHQNDGVGYELGSKFTADVAGQITAIRFWKDSYETGTHTGRIWNASGTLLASVTFTAETASGWQSQKLPAPLTISAKTPYVVTVNTVRNYYVATTSGFAAQVNSGNLHSVVGANGVYGPIGRFPTNSYMNSNYFRDVLFVPSSSSTSVAGSVAVSVSPSTASLQTGATKQFTASVSGTTNTAVTWSVVSGGGTISSTGLYKAPNSASTATIRATSVADTSRSASATITVSAPAASVAVSVSPSTASLQTGATQQFTATVSGSTAGVSWSVVSGGGSISSSGLYTAPGTATSATIKAVSNSDALVSDSASITVSAAASGAAGCGAGGTYPNLVPLNQSACGNVIADGSALSYEPAYNATSATALSCGSTISANGSYKLNGNLNCGAGSSALTISPAGGASSILVNLNGYTVTGYLQVNDWNGAVKGGVHIFNGTINCTTSSANNGACLYVTTSNGAAPPAAANVFHHLTMRNSADSSSAFVVDGAFSSPMSGAQATGGAYSDVLHHLTITVVGGTSGTNRAGAGGVAGTNRTVHYYNLKITNGDTATNHYTEGVDCYNTFNCDVHNSYFAPNRITTGDTPGRMILLDGDAYGNGPCASCMTQNGHVYNNYFNANDVRAIRQRSAKNVHAHDNLFDNVQDPPSNISNSGTVHFGDLTSAGPNNTGVYDLGASRYERNLFVFNGPVSNGGAKAFGDGINAIGMTITDNRIMCSGTGCSGISARGHAVNVGTQDKGSPRYADVKVCNFTYDSALPTPLNIDGSSETQTSYLRGNNAGACSASGGAQCTTITSCQ